MADAIAPANISLNLVNEEFWTCGHSNTVNGERLEYLWASLSGDWGQEPLRQPRAPGVVSVRSLQGLSQNASPSRTSQIDPAQALYIGRSMTGCRCSHSLTSKCRDKCQDTVPRFVWAVPSYQLDWVVLGYCRCRPLAPPMSADVPPVEVTCAHLASASTGSLRA